MHGSLLSGSGGIAANWNICVDGTERRRPMGGVDREETKSGQLVRGVANFATELRLNSECVRGGADNLVRTLPELELLRSVRS